MALPLDKEVYEMLVRCVARCEMKINKLLERKSEDAKSVRYMRGVIRRLRDSNSEQRIYIKKLERELKL